MASTSQILSPTSQACSSDPWSFLELIDAPQWADLSLEASLMGKEGFDSWFDRSHKHHVMSLAGFNTNMPLLRLGKLDQGKAPIFSEGCRKEVTKPEKKQNAAQLNKLVSGQSQSQSQAMGLQVPKATGYSNNTERGCNARKLYGSVETGCSFSGLSSTSECEPSGSFKKHSLCSDRSSISSSLQASSVQIKKFSSSAQTRRGSSSVNQSEDFHDTPTTSCGGGGAHRSSNSSSASYCPPMVKSRNSSDVGVSKCTKSSEFCVSTVPKLQFVCEADHQSSGDSVATSVSGVSNALEEQVGKGCARTLEATDGLRKINVLKDDVDYIEPLSRDFVADLNTLSENLLHGQQMAKEVVKNGMKAGRERLEMRVSQVMSLPSKQLYTGKENAPPKENFIVGNFLQVKDKPFRSKAPFLQVKDKPFHSKAPFAFASSKTANARTDGSNLSGRLHASQVKKKEGPLCASQVIPRKSGAVQNMSCGGASSIGHQRKRCEANQVTAMCEKTRESERHLAALIAQHNQQFCSGRPQNCRKGLR